MGKTKSYFSVTVILLLVGLFLSNFSFRSPSPVSILSRQTTVDNVTITLQSNFIAGEQFELDKQSSSAIISQYHPYEYFSIEAIPYGYSAPNELSGTVRAGSAASVSAEIQKNRLEQGAKIVANTSPVAELFGKSVSGAMYQFSLALYSNISTPVVITDWVTEAGNRLWIIHTIQEQQNGLNVSNLQNQLGTIIITSATLNNKSALASANNSTTVTPVHLHTASVATVPYPSWWNGNCDVNNHSDASLYASWNGLDACGPGAAYQGGYDTVTHFFSGAFGEKINRMCCIRSHRNNCGMRSFRWVSLPSQRFACWQKNMGLRLRANLKARKFVLLRKMIIADS